VHLTGTGRALVVAAVVLTVAGVALGQPGTVGIGIAGLLVTLVAALTVAEAPKVEVERAVRPHDVDRGKPAEVSLAFRGTAPRARPFSVVETVAGERRSAAMPALRAGERASIAYELDTSRRGTITAGPLQLRRTDPFGLVVAERRIAGTASVQVRPRRHPIAMLPSGRWRDLEGPTREVSRGTATFHQLRDYVPGDDMRHIHWRATARTGDLIVREHVDTTKPEVVVIVDNRERAVGADDFEEAVDVGASVLAAAEQAGFPTRLLFSDGREEREDGIDQLPHLDRLTAVRRSEVGSLQQLADALRARGRSLVFIGGELDPQDLRLLAKIAHGFSPAILVSVQADRRAPFVAPPGVVGIPCASAAGFVATWGQHR
jgi:uncharacterized protein (DUF58 family)